MAPKPTNIDKKSIAKSLFMNGDFTLEEIAEKVGVTSSTICRWAKSDGWSELKAANTITPDQIISQLNHQLIEINNNIASREPGKRFATPAEGDAIAKISKSIKNLEAEMGITEIVSVSMKFLSWLRPLDIELAKRFNNLFDSFIKDSAR